MSVASLSGVAGPTADARMGRATTELGPGQGAFAVQGGAVAHAENRTVVFVGRLSDRRDSELPQARRERIARELAERHDLLEPRGWLSGLRGQFLVLAWDHGCRRGVLARDQQGGMSLFYAARGDSTLFASELTPLLAMLPRRPDPDETSVVSWLATTTVPVGASLYRGVGDLPAGCFLRLPAARQPERYWQPRFDGYLDIGCAEAVRLLDGGLLRATARSLDPGDAPAVLLSGGLDSSLVLAAASDRADRVPELQHPVSYSAVFPEDPATDESEPIATTARHLGVESRRIPFSSGKPLEQARAHQRDWGAPLPAPNAFIWSSLLERMASEAVSVCIDGEGGDELWMGGGGLVTDLIRRGRPVAAHRVLGAWLGGAIPARAWPTVWRRFARRSLLPDLAPPRLRQRLRERGDPERFAPGHIAAGWGAALRDLEGERMSRRGSEGPTDWRKLRDLLTLQRDLLGVGAHLRRRAAGRGLRDAHPMLDVDLVELVLRLDPRLSVPGALDRPLARKLALRRVPATTAHRPHKSVFNPIFERSLQSESDQVRELLGPGSEVGRFLDPEWRSRVAASLSGTPSRELCWAVWRSVTAELWLRDQT